MKISTLRIGRWEVKTGEIRKIQTEIIKKLEEFINEEWLAAFPLDKEPAWWTLRVHKLPSPIIRVDIPALSSSESLRIKNYIYEVEVRPAGLGIMLLLSPPDIKHSWRRVLAEFKCQGIINIESNIQDDRVAAEILEFPFYSNYEEIPKKNDEEKIYWIRTNLREGEKIIELEQFSLVPIKLDGDKTYLINLGIAKEIEWEEPFWEKTFWEEPFVVKPLIGSRMEGVEIYLPPYLKKEFSPGSSSRKRVLEKISLSNVKYLIQSFIPPQPEEINGVKGYTIWRIFLSWKGENGYKFSGGLWNWRRSIRIHGSTDSIMGPLAVKEG